MRFLCNKTDDCKIWKQHKKNKLMNKSDVEDLMLYGERINVEYKEAFDALPKSVWETYSSFANTIGGVIVLGIKEHLNRSANERFEIKGVGNVDRLLKSFWDTVNSDKVSRNILVDEDVECVDYDGKNIVVIRIPMANYTMRPVYINRNLLGGSFKRNYEGDYHCTDEEVKSMLRDANENGNDGVMIENYNMDDIDLPTLRAYRNRFEIRNVDHVFNQLDDKEFLRNMGGYTVDRNTRREGLTVAGLMMFGKGLSVRERFDNIRMDYIDKENADDNSRWSDRFTYDGTWENNLYNFFTRVMPKLTSNLKRPFKLEGMERIDDTPVHKAIREAMTNMIIHADFFITGVLKVEKYSNEFIFSNPGSLMLPIEDIMIGGNSKARNPRIQNMLRMIGYGDNIGSGYPAILKTWKEENWRKPTLLDRTELRQVDLTLPMISLLPENVLQEMKSCYGYETYGTLKATEQNILAYVWCGESVSNIELQQMLGLNSIEVGKILHNMVEKQLLKRENKNRWTTYSAIKKSDEVSESDKKSECESDKKKTGDKKDEIESDKKEISGNESVIVSDKKSEYVSDKKKTGDKKGRIVSDKKKKSDKKGVRASDKKRKRVSRSEFTDIERKVFELIVQDVYITYETLGTKLSLSKTTLYKAVRSLKENKIIMREGGRKNGHWVIKRDFVCTE